MINLFSQISTTAVTSPFTLKTELLELGREQLYTVPLKLSDFRFFLSAEEFFPFPRRVSSEAAASGLKNNPVLKTPSKSLP